MSPLLPSKTVLEIPITIATEESILEEITKYLKNQNPKFKIQSSKSKNDKGPMTIFTPNPEIVMEAQRDPEFKRIVTAASINIPDGSGVVWAIRRQYGPIVNRIAGADMVQKLVKKSAEFGFRIGLIGGKAGVALDVKECLMRSYPGLSVEVLETPEFRMEKQENSESGIKNQESRIRNQGKEDIDDSCFIILDSEPEKTDAFFQSAVRWIEKKRIDMIFVALGHPKQEYFIQALIDQRPASQRGEPKTRDQRPIVLMAVGGTFDYIAGRVRRAPIWMRERGLEWLYRLVREPSRIGRQLRGAEFFLTIAWHGR